MTDFPNNITNYPANIEVQIFADDIDHLPFHVISKPAEVTLIKVKIFYKNKVKEKIVDNKYQFAFNQLLYDNGIRIQDNKYVFITNDF